MMSKIPPHNIEFEQSVLSACMLYRDDLEAALDLLSPDDFYRPAHVKIFDAMRKLKATKSVVDLVSVTDAVREHGIQAGYVSEVSMAPVAVNMEFAAENIRRYKIARDMIQLAERAQRRLFESSALLDLQTVIDEAQAAFLSVDTGGSKLAFEQIGELTMQSLERYQAMKTGTMQRGLHTGFSELDAITGGLRGSQLVILAARPRIGKTAMMLNMARHMAKAKRKVGIFSIEMDAAELDDRLFGMESGLNTLRITRGHYESGAGPHADDWPKIQAAAERKSAWPMWIDDTGGLTIQELKRRARKIKNAQNIEVLFIDQFSKIKGDRRKNKFEEATQIVEELGDLKKELRIPIVLLAQLNRNAEDRPDKEPALADLKNTGQLEEEADIVLLLHRSYEYTRNEADREKAVLMIAKHRSGPCRNIQLRWDEKQTMFQDLNTGGC